MSTNDKKYLFKVKIEKTLQHNNFHEELQWVLVSYDKDKEMKKCYVIFILKYFARELNQYSLQQNFYEVICNGQPRHIYIDYDKSYETSNHMFDMDDLQANQFIAEFMTDIFNYLVMKGLDGEIYDCEWAILTSTVNNETKKKISYHAILHIFNKKTRIPLMLTRNDVMKTLLQQIKTEIEDNTDNLSKICHLQCIDFNVYGSNQNFRTIYSTKYGEQTRMMPAYISGCVTYNLLTFQESTFITLMPNNQFENADVLFNAMIEDSLELGFCS